MSDEYSADLKTKINSQLLSTMTEKLVSDRTYEVIPCNNDNEIILRFAAHQRNPNHVQDARIVLAKDHLYSGTKAERESLVSLLQELLNSFDSDARIEEL